MKKVLFVATFVKKHIMVFHLPYLQWFKDNNYEVHVCSKNDYENKEDCYIPFCDKFFDIPFERNPFNLKNIRVYKELKKIIECNDYEIIHCHTPMGGALSRLAAMKAREKGTFVIYTAHGFHFYSGAPIKNWLIYYPVERYLAKYTDVLITINKEDYNRVRDKFKAKRIEYIPGVGINTSKFSEVVVDKKEIRRKLGVPQEGIILLSVGEVNKNKNHEVIIKAIAKIKNPNIYYVICGRGNLEVKIKMLSQKLGIGNNVKLLGYRDDLEIIYKSVDIFAFPSYREGLSVSLMEAMSAGLPIVSSKIRGNMDLIKSGNGGYLIMPSDVNGFAKAIVKVIENNFEMGKINAELAKKFDLKSIKSRMEQIYKIPCKDSVKS